MKTKIILLSVFSAILLVLVGCNNYSKITYAKATVFKKKQVVKEIDNYDLFVHQKDKVFQLENPIIEDNQLSGKPVEITPEELSPLVENEPTEEELNDIHIYLNEEVEQLDDQQERQTFSEANVNKVDMYGKERGAYSMTLLYILLGVLTFGILLLVLAIVAVSQSENNGSDSGSNSSNSNDSMSSDSNSGGSGDSNSGGSNSGGSNSGSSGSNSGGSGCYIATMSYGSYDAPQVLVLREFRDHFLQRFSAGRSFISWYYKTSPSFVEKHRSKKWLHSSIRLLLNILVLFLKPFYSGGNARA